MDEAGVDDIERDGLAMLRQEEDDGEEGFLVGEGQGDPNRGTERVLFGRVDEGALSK